MKNIKKNLISKLEEIKDGSTYLYDEQVREIQNLCNDYMNETQDRSLEECFEEYVDYEIAEEYVKRQIEEWGLARLPRLAWNCDFMHYDHFKINAYWNLENIDYRDVECLVDELVDRLQD